MPNTVDERRTFLEGLNLNEETINTIIDAEDKPETVHEWSKLEEVMNRESN